jgi:hypothetical protein
MLANPWSSFWSAALPGNFVETFVTAAGFMLQEVQENLMGRRQWRHSLFKSCLRNSESYNGRRHNQLDDSPSGNKDCKNKFMMKQRFRSATTSDERKIFCIWLIRMKDLLLLTTRRVKTKMNDKSVLWELLLLNGFSYKKGP